MTEAHVPTSGLSAELAETVLRQGEIRLSAQLQLALAADARATTFAAILIAVATALFGFAGDQFSGAAHDTPLAVGAIGAGVVLLIAAAVCIFAARPIKFDLAGAVPENWWDDGVTDRAYADCLRKESDNYTRRIKDNRRCLSSNAKLFRSGMLLACASPVIGLGLWVFARSCL